MARKKVQTKRPRKRGRASQGPQPEDVAAIVGEVLVHFGAGWGAQRQIGMPPTVAPTYSEIFDSPKGFWRFHHVLFGSTTQNFWDIDWRPGSVERSGVCKAAFEHGVAARREVLDTATLDESQVLKTLEEIKKKHCPGDRGRVCKNYP